MQEFCWRSGILNKKHNLSGVVKTPCFFTALLVNYNLSA
ncbi:ferredoxin [Aggregatibacter aphrophilus NJ8700]|nr:ferredoxin [Aggregatibacter aphrophilus NJ8700]